MKFIFVLFLGLNLSLLPGCRTRGSGVPPAAQAGAPRADVYLAQNLFDQLKANIPDFPAAESPAQAADERELHRLQKARNAADCRRALVEVQPSLKNLFGAPYFTLSDAQLKMVQPLFDRLLNEAGPYIGQTKRAYNRLRPYDYIKGLKPCIDREKSLAYPSGHATIAMLYALVFNDLFPEKKTDLLDRAQQIGQDRVLAGVHHPTDIASGNLLGELIYAELKKSSRYLQDVERYGAALRGI